MHYKGSQFYFLRLSTNGMNYGLAFLAKAGPYFTDPEVMEGKRRPTPFPGHMLQKTTKLGFFG